MTAEEDWCQSAHRVQGIVAAVLSQSVPLDAFPLATYLRAPGLLHMEWVNTGIERLTGWLAEDWCSEALVFERMHPADRYRVLSDLGEAEAQGGGHFLNEYRVRTRLGRVVWLRDEAVLGVSPDGRRRWQGVLIDVTERRQMEDALREREGQQAALARLSRLAVSSTDAVELFTQAVALVADRLNLDLCALLQPSGNDMTVRAAAGPRAANLDPAAIGSSLAQEALESGRPAFAGQASANATGLGGTVLSAAVPLISLPRRFGVLFAECTPPQVLGDDDLNFLRSIANVLTGALTRLVAVDELLRAERLSAVGQLYAGVAHDFNNVLSVVLGFSELLSESLTDPDAQEAVKQIKAAGRQGQALVEQLLTYSRGQKPAMRVVDVRQLLQELTALMRPVFPPGIDLDSETDAGPVLVSADRGQLEQVLMNLVVNARDAMTAGTIRLRAEGADITAPTPTSPPLPPGRYVLVAVSDEGCGMDEATIARVFEPFFTTKPAGQGTGLGLATSMQILLAHGGSMAIASEVGRGTTFTIYLPAADSIADVGAPSSQLPPVLGPVRRIMVVDDEPGVRSLMSSALRREGFEAIEAADGEEGVALFERERPNLLVTDIDMPGMSGMDLAKHIRAVAPDVPILLVSGHADATIRGLELPLLLKPFELHELAATVASLLDAQPAH